MFFGGIIVWLLLESFSEKQKEENTGKNKRAKVSNPQKKEQKKQEKQTPLKTSTSRKKKEIEEEDDDSNLEKFNDKRQTKVEKRKVKIVEKLKKKDTLQSGEVADMFQVSRVTAFRYLDDLEEEGRIKQAGKTGRSVHYSLK